MTASGGPSGVEQDIGGLAALPGLEAVTGQLAGVISVLRAEQARRRAGIPVSRPAWRNLVFTGGPGAGKSRVARAVARIYRDLGLLAYGELLEIAAADLVGVTAQGTGTLVDGAIRPSGDLLMITGADVWRDLPDGGEHVLRCLYHKLTEARTLSRRDGLAVILAGRAGPLRDLLGTSPALAARFLAVIDFPGYTPGELAAVFAALAAEAGFTLSPAAAGKAAAVLACAEAGHGSGNARLAVRLLAEVTASQARRVTVASQPPDPAALSTISEADIPGQLRPYGRPAGDQRPGQYL
jgi:hypothetical protein